MSVIKKIILTIILIVFLLFLQSYVFSDTCTLNPNDPALNTVKVGCNSNECSFFLFRNSNLASSPFNSCISQCNSPFFEDNYNCIQQCIIENSSNIIDIYKESNLIFTKNNCDGKKINIILGSNINFEMKNTTTSLSVSGVDYLNTNGKNIDIFVNNNDKLGDATFNFSNLIITGNTLIKMRTKERSSIPNLVDMGWNDWTRDGLKFIFNDIEVKNNSKLDINIFIPKNILIVNDNLDLRKINSYLPGGEITFDGNNIFNKGNINLYIKSQDSQDGKNYIDQGNCFDDPESQGGSVKDAGHVYFYLNYIKNDGNFTSNIFSGNGGIGGKGSRAQGNCSNDPPGHGGHGGNGGNIFLYIDKIYNTNIFDMNLVAGNGGNGGDTGFDGSGIFPNPNYAKGGSGGSGGNIYFCKITWINGFECYDDKYDSLINNGIFRLSAKTGKGNNGGNKINQINVGEAGNGGNGGNFISDFKIDFLENRGNFNINLESNFNGLKGETPGGLNGVPGSTKSFILNYLLNNNDNFNILIISRKDVSLGTSDIIINRLQTGSYLPKKLYTVSGQDQILYDPICENNCNSQFELCCSQGNCNDWQNSCITEFNSCLSDCENTINYSSTNRKITINSACYIKKPNNILNYKTEIFNINLANSDLLQNYIPSGVNNNVNVNTDCSLCDYYDFEGNEIFPNGSANKFLQTYYLYSSKEGVINQNNLKIYYAKNNSEFTKINSLYNPFTKENNLPLYINKEPITSVYNEKLKLYEYKISPDKLQWYYDKDMNLSSKDIFCYYQNYRIEGKIGEVTFNFPFTPLFKN